MGGVWLLGQLCGAWGGVGDGGTATLVATTGPGELATRVDREGDQGQATGDMVGVLGRGLATVGLVGVGVMLYLWGSLLGWAWA